MPETLTPGDRLDDLEDAQGRRYRETKRQRMTIEDRGGELWACIEVTDRDPPPATDSDGNPITDNRKWKRIGWRLIDRGGQRIAKKATKRAR